MNRAFYLILLLSGCTATQQIATQTGFQSQTERKQKQKVILLQKRLTAAESALLEEQQEVEALRYHLFDAELNLIELQLEYLEEKWKKDPPRLIQSLRQGTTNLLFLEEREKLHRCIQMGSSAPRAQALLDRMLQLITQVSDFVY